MKLPPNPGRARSIGGFCLALIVALALGCGRPRSESPSPASTQSAAPSSAQPRSAPIKPAVPIRWKYTDEANVEEIAARRRIVSRIDDWWSAFRKNADKIDAHYEKGEKFEIVEFTSKELKLIHPELFWEYGPALEGKGHRLVITPETGRHLRPLVDAILARAPSLPGWEFYAYRPPEDHEQAQRAVIGRTKGDISKTLSWRRLESTTRST
ncbi:MAG: hypothetical protein ACI9VS_000465 [Candidatus Binatia bacterium]|jgi:hypothetical protein